AGREALQLAASALGAVAVAGLFSTPGTVHVLWPLLGAAMVGWLVPAVLPRLGRGGSLTAVVGTLAVVVAAAWTSVPRTVGVPTRLTAHALSDSLRSSRAELAHFVVPLHPLAGALFLAGVVVGLVALYQRLALASARPARLVSLAPLAGTLALVSWSAAARGGWGATALVAAFALLAFLCVMTSGTSDAGEVGEVGRSPAGGAGLAATVVGVVAVATAVVVAALPTGATAPASRSVAPTGLSLTDHLVDLEIHDPNVLLFTAKTPVTSYWQVAVLSELRNGVFTPAPPTVKGLRGQPAPAVAPALPPGATGAYTGQVTVAHLSSRLLPVPPTTVAVRATPPAVVSAGGVVTDRATTPGRSYEVLAARPPTVQELARQSSIASPASGAPAQDLALPKLPPAIHALAVRASAAGATPFTRAIALEDWLRSGRFRYTLKPPATPPGSDPLVDFLTHTHRGTCEQFAGAFTVLARSLGIPARVAVGFTTGTRAHGVTVVRGRDAHAWPEVYLGPALGWVSFEPTPSQPSGEQTPAGILGPVPIVAPAPPPGDGSSTPTTVPATVTTAPSVTRTTTPTTATTGPRSTTTPATRATVAARGTGASPWWWVITLLAVGVAALVAVAASWASRRRRRARAPAPRVIGAWRSVERPLRRSGVSRPAGRSPLRHVALLEATRPAGSDQLAAVLSDLARLGEATERAGYAARPVSTEEATQTEEAAHRVVVALRSASLRRELRLLALAQPAADAAAAASRA
ncbi:MAG TPA: transglutaminase-like domain-containing protein, partial [Acidimicrobiales bacterium]